MCYSFNWMQYLYVITIFLLFGIIFWILRRYLRERKVSEDAYKPQYPKKKNFEFLDIVRSRPFNKKDKSFTGQDESWQEELKNVGEQLKKHKVGHVFLVHGTFAGDDPFDLVSMVGKTIPGMSEMIQKTIRGFVHKRQRAFFREMGNFTNEYIGILEDAWGSEIEIVPFVWSSANHHLARVKGAIDLISKIANTLLLYNKGERVLLIGHSHAGQLFVIMSQMLSSKKLRKKFLNIASRAGYNTALLMDYIMTLKQYGPDMVTLGTPVRYEWMLGKNMRLLHFINHRGKEPFGWGAEGILFTRDGDYIQQYGVAGSDLLSPISNERELNILLDDMLGVGSNLSLWRRRIKERRRIHNVGRSLLIDYKDSAIYPNFLKTLFGHGVYTRTDVMLFNFKLIAKHFYGDMPRM